MKQRIQDERTDFQDPTILTNRYKKAKSDEVQAIRTLEKLAQSLPKPYKTSQHPSYVDLTPPVPVEVVDLTAKKTPLKKIPSLMELVSCCYELT